MTGLFIENCKILCYSIHREKGIFIIYIGSVIFFFTVSGEKDYTYYKGRGYHYEKKEPVIKIHDRYHPIK
jgi:hypothetical protein